MEDQGFYTVFPSNASTDVFPSNKQHSFRIKIPSSLPFFKGDWVVGLTEIQFPALWQNLIHGYIIVKYQNGDNPLKCELHDGTYTTIEELLTEIKYALQSAQLQDDIVMKFDQIRNRVILQVKDRAPGFGIGFSQNLLNMLGFTKTENEFYSAGTYVEKAADITEGFSALYIYSDIVQNRIVGDTMASLVRVVPIEQKRLINSSGVNWVWFQHIQYIPVNKTYTDTVEINIRRDNGDIVPFESGKVVLTLHFKKV